MAISSRSSRTSRRVMSRTFTAPHRLTSGMCGLLPVVFLCGEPFSSRMILVAALLELRVVLEVLLRQICERLRRRASIFAAAGSGHPPLDLKARRRLAPCVRQSESRVHAERVAPKPPVEPIHDAPGLAACVRHAESRGPSRCRRSHSTRPVLGRPKRAKNGSVKRRRAMGSPRLRVTAGVAGGRDTGRIAVQTADQPLMHRKRNVVRKLVVESCRSALCSEIAGNSRVRAIRNQQVTRSSRVAGSNFSNKFTPSGSALGSSASRHWRPA